MERIYHPWDKWECFKCGFYDTSPPEGMDAKEAMREYSEFLRDAPRFRQALRRVISEWPNSCEQFLSNQSLNRIAWLGQASMCIATGIPACFRGGFQILNDSEQRVANATAEEFLNEWLEGHERKDSPVCA